MAPQDPFNGTEEPAPKKRGSVSFVGILLILVVAIGIFYAGSAFFARHGNLNVTSEDNELTYGNDTDTGFIDTNGDGINDADQLADNGHGQQAANDGNGGLIGAPTPYAPPQEIACPGKTEEVAHVSDNGRFFGHFPYPERRRGQLVSAPAGFASGSCQFLAPEAANALRAMIAAARTQDPNLAASMVGLSCHRSIAYQHDVFCRGVQTTLANRALASAPPGYSEHATGLAIDFGDRKAGCNLSACFATTPVGRWLYANARGFGFEMSFPSGNGQGVSYEPWHWRYIGGPSAGVFADARGQFPAGGQYNGAVRAASSEGPDGKDANSQSNNLSDTGQEPNGNNISDNQNNAGGGEISAPSMAPSNNGITAGDTGVVQTPPQ